MRIQLRSFRETSPTKARAGEVLAHEEQRRSPPGRPPRSASRTRRRGRTPARRPGDQTGTRGGPHRRGCARWTAARTNRIQPQPGGGDTPEGAGYGLSGAVEGGLLAGLFSGRGALMGVPTPRTTLPRCGVVSRPKDIRRGGVPGNSTPRNRRPLKHGPRKSPPAAGWPRRSRRSSRSPRSRRRSPVPACGPTRPARPGRVPTMNRLASPAAPRHQADEGEADDRGVALRIAQQEAAEDGRQPEGELLHRRVDAHEAAPLVRPRHGRDHRHPRHHASAGEDHHRGGGGQDDEERRPDRQVRDRQDRRGPSRRPGRGRR